MTIERQRNFFGFFNLIRELEPGKAVHFKKKNLGREEAITIEVVSPDMLHVVKSKVEEPTNVFDKPRSLSHETYQKEKINLIFLSGSRRFGIRDRIIWKK